MRRLWIPAALLAALLAAPASAETRSYRAVGTVTQVIGDPALLTFTVAAGDPIVMDFTYDDATPDLLPTFPTLANYAVLEYIVRIGGRSSQFFIDPRIAIQAGATDPNLWGARACFNPCNEPFNNQARVNLFLPPDTFASDALTTPPDPAGAQVQFGLFSRGDTAGSEAFVVAELASLEEIVPTDTDGDGVDDAIDNCRLVPNTAQLDADQDGYGNRCDGDLNNSGSVNAADLALFRVAFASTDPVANLDGEGSVNAEDLAILRTLFGRPPGPSGVRGE